MQIIDVSMFQAHKNNTYRYINTLFYETLPETFMKQCETSTPKKETGMFHKCFKPKITKSLFFLSRKPVKNHLKHQCFTLCFIKNAGCASVNSDSDILKHFSTENLKTGLFEITGLKI